MKPVESSSIKAIGHDPDTCELRILFHNGRAYNYYGVPAHEYELLMVAKSVGSHHNRFIKGKFDHARHED